MIAALPSDLLEFLGAGSQLAYDSRNSSIGNITLKSEGDLALTTITTYPGCQSIIDDPYERLDGLYQIDAYDLVAASEDYDLEGLLCWIVGLDRFGCIDPEHGDVITFPGVTWTKIIAEPLPYLDAQWSSDGVGVRVLPWIHFPFKLRDGGAVIQPYGSKCPIHGAPITVQQIQKSPLFEVLQRREMSDWLRNYLTTFPSAGVPISSDEVLCCSDCRAAEDAWMQRIDSAIETADVTPNVHGWVKCPGCGIRFSLNDDDRFDNERHLSCGQKLRVVSAG